MPLLFWNEVGFGNNNKFLRKLKRLKREEFEKVPEIIFLFIPNIMTFFRALMNKEYVWVTLEK